MIITNYCINRLAASIYFQNTWGELGSEGGENGH